MTKGKHEEIVAHLKEIMPARAKITRKNRKQNTTLYLQNETDLVILNALYGEHIRKIYRLKNKDL